MTRPPILFFHSVDKDNLNAQSNNTKEVLARWNAEDFPASALYFRTPDPRVAENSNVRLIKLQPDRLWKIRAMMAGLGSFSAVVYPGLAAQLDNRVRRFRSMLGLGGAVVTTLEGLPANADAMAAENTRLSEIAGHRVYGQPVPSSIYAALYDLKGEADLIISISSFLERMASQIWPQVPSTCCPLGVDLAVFHPRGRVPHGAKDKVRVISAGSFQPTKRPEVFVDLAQRYPHAEFIWFGEGETRAMLIAQSRDKSLTNISFPGTASPSQLAQAFRSADLFVMPSISEGVPKVTQEAAACGLPVVCMNFFEPFSVVDGLNGFQAQNDDEFLERVATLMDDACLRARMAASGEKLAENWNWDALAKLWQDQICAAALKSPRLGGE